LRGTASQKNFLYIFCPPIGGLRAPIFFLLKEKENFSAWLRADARAAGFNTARGQKVSLSPNSLPLFARSPEIIKKNLCRMFLEFKFLE
jgi:hypothetical protein